MNIPQSILEEYIIPKEYYKPKIEIRNFYLKWNDESYGIPQKEINELRKFLTNAIPFFDIGYQLLNSFEKAKYKDKYHLNKELSSGIRISYANKHIYELHMHPDGSTFIDRIESIQPIKPTTEIDNETVAKRTDMKRHKVKPIFYFKWTLGELLFNRQGE